MANYKMKPGSKQKDTPGSFNIKQSDTIGKLSGQKLGKQLITSSQRTKPDITDSIAVSRSNSIRKELGMDSSWSDIADKAESKFGKIDVSNFKEPKGGRGGTSGDAFRKRKEYGLGKFKKKK
jgi:hypothetical protein